MKNVILDYYGGAVAARLDRSEKTLLSDVRFTISEGESLALIGETGAGKTMTALSIMGLLPQNVRQSGARVVLCGRDITDPAAARKMLGDELVYIPQSGAEHLNPALTVRRHMFDSAKRLGVGRAGLERAAKEKLADAGFSEPEEILDKYPFQLSGGMAQRVTIAISALAEAKLIIADEPTNGLDSEGKRRFFGMLGSLFPDAGKLIITHDMSVAGLCGRTAVLCGGRLAETGASVKLLKAPKHPYTRALMAALVQNGMSETPVLRPQNGECPFFSRCPRASGKCLATPEHRIEGDSDWWCCEV